MRRVISDAYLNMNLLSVRNINTIQYTYIFITNTGPFDMCYDTSLTHRGHVSVTNIHRYLRAL